MSEINILSPHVADLIAAGEVVERPASVIKELMENSIDAGARNISVEIRGGGMSYIRVTDDGRGMSPEDAGICFLRHATSKLKDANGLESIATLGFRGEALAAISSVSRVELTTRTAGAAEGVRVSLTAGDIQEMGPVGCPEGSTMTVSDLFFNTPARQKFMKSDRAEASACVAAALRCALGHPEISVRMIKDGREEFFSPGDGRAESCVYSLLGRDTAKDMLECSGDDGEVAVSGYISAPHAGRGNRSMQFFFINGRAFRSAAVQAALEQAYRNTLLTGRYPACVLYIRLSFGKVDVNVHPTKAEVKFSDEKKVFDAVYYAALSALGSDSSAASTAEIELSRTTRRALEPRQDFYRTMTSREFRERVEKSSAPAPVQTRLELDTGLTFRQSGPAYAPSHSVPRRAAPAVPERETPMVSAKKSPAEPPLSPIPEDFRVVGEILDTYIVVEENGGMLLIDKHACHERIIFDRLTAAREETMSQTLLSPVTWSPGARTAELLESNSDELERAGFEIEPFGDDSIIIRAVPCDGEGSEIAMLEEIAEALKTGRPVNRRDIICHTVACKAAIKAGSGSDIRELEALARRVVSGEIRYCPHGRPVSVRLTKAELDKFFKRIVG